MTNTYHITTFCPACGYENVREIRDGSTTFPRVVYRTVTCEDCQETYAIKVVFTMVVTRHKLVIHDD